MSAMGQHFGGSFLQVAFDRFSSPDLLDFARRWKIDLVEVESLKRTSAKIQALFDEAEVVQFTSGAVKPWLHHVKQLFYDAEDILDEYATELLQLKLESENRPHSHQSQQSGTESAKGINKRFESKVREINKRLKGEAQEGVALGLNSSMGSGSSSRLRVFSRRPKTSSLVNISEVFGRDDDKFEIIKWLLSADKTARSSNFSVLPIVGMGGAGKTTLAQLVYNDDRVGRHFGLKAWVCVTENFDEVRMTKEILEAVTGSSPTFDSLDLLQVKLKEALSLSKKRFLLVLDDMWNEDYERWCALRTPFAFGKPGSKILVTTRNKRVSSIMRTDPNDHDHDVKGLSDDDCIALFRKHAFMDGNSSDANRKLEVLRGKIVKKCKGLPLAAKTLAGLLLDKMENREWEDILENEIWDLIRERESESGILSSLMLSYHHLPPVLKRCFQYCALFPKDYVFNKIELVMLWMAEGIVQPKGEKRLEDIGAGYFDELFMRSFFDLSDRCPSNQPSPFSTPDNDYASEGLFYKLSKEFHSRSFFESTNTNTGSGFVIHDLIHDLAQFVSDGIYCRKEEYDNRSSEVFTTTRHLSYITENFNVEATESEAMKSLRTLIDLGNNHFGSMPSQFQFQFLRVLCIRKCRNHKLPNSIGKLKHLRLLDLSFSFNIMRLPNSITSLYNLLTLILTGCWCLRELPKDMGNLVNLRHLLLPESSSYASNKMALTMGVNLTNLQTLNTFIVGSKNSNELRDLSQLRGTLDISNLENVGNINGTKATVTNLKKNPHLLGLRLRWRAYKSKDSFPDLGRDEKVEEDVLDQLQPHINLEALWIQNYGGTRLPSWMQHPSFSNLETVSLSGCHKCKFLPHLSQLPMLKHLVIDGCGATTMVGSELYGDGSSSSTNKQFRSLETLHIERMEEWEEWREVVEEEEEEEGGGGGGGGGGQFPCLHKLLIKECPKLWMFSHRFPALVEMEINECHDLRVLPRLLPSLQRLSIWGCPKLEVPSIESLSLVKCELITHSFASVR